MELHLHSRFALMARKGTALSFKWCISSHRPATSCLDQLMPLIRFLHAAPVVQFVVLLYEHLPSHEHIWHQRNCSCWEAMQHCLNTEYGGARLVRNADSTEPLVQRQRITYRSRGTKQTVRYRNCTYRIFREIAKTRRSLTHDWCRCVYIDCT
jgi:hypothetical protein